MSLKLLCSTRMNGNVLYRWDCLSQLHNLHRFKLIFPRSARIAQDVLFVLLNHLPFSTIHTLYRLSNAVLLVQRKNLSVLICPSPLSVHPKWYSTWIVEAVLLVLLVHQNEVNLPAQYQYYKIFTISSISQYILWVPKEKYKNTYADDNHTSKTSRIILPFISKILQFLGSKIGIFIDNIYSTT